MCFEYYYNNEPQKCALILLHSTYYLHYNTIANGLEQDKKSNFWLSSQSKTVLKSQNRDLSVTYFTIIIALPINQIKCKVHPLWLVT